MDAIRRAVTRYADRLDQQAQRHETHAFILGAVAHRLRQILHDNPESFTHPEFGVIKDGKIVPKEVMGEPKATNEATGESGTGTSGPLFKRWVTEWKEIK